jgi:glucose/arabinose dehydrogenase
LAAPTGLVVLPDGIALVGERATGRIVQVQPTPGKPVKLVRTLSGLDASGSGGLLDLALSATYGEDGLILALITTRTDVRVVHFTLRGVVTPILTGIPRARIANAGRLMVRPDGTIFVGTSGAGSAALAADPTSLAGKVLRIDDVGQPAAGNPLPGSPVLTAGHAHVDGLCAGPLGAVYEVEADATDQINYLSAGTRYGAGGAPPISRPGVTKGISDCAVVGSTLYVTGLGGKGLFSATITTPTKLSPFTAQLQGKYGRLRTVVAATDGTLWLTTSNLDGHGTPVPDDERVLHIRPARGGGPSPV